MSASPTLTKAQWDALRGEMASAYGCARLRVGEHEISLQVRRLKALRYAICVYVDGWFRGEWFSRTEPPHPIAVMFYPTRTGRLYRISAEKRRKLERTVGKKWVRDHYDKTYSYREPCFRSFGALRKHFQQHCPSIELLAVGGSAIAGLVAEADASQ